MYGTGIDVVVFAKATNSVWLAVICEAMIILHEVQSHFSGEHHVAAPGYLGFTLQRSVSNLMKN